jgi:predicted lipoprotein with Yx(FWY)xxD motif
MKLIRFIPLLAFTLAACGQAANAGTPAATPSKTAVTIKVGSSAKLGSFLVTASGRTLYYFTPEHDSHLACTGQCATIWIPLLDSSGLLTTPEVLPGTLTTIPRGSSRQVTYSDWPLYTFTGDLAPGDTNGQGMFGKWFVASTSLMEDLPTPTPAPSIAPTKAAPAPTPRPTVRPTVRATAMPTSCIPGANGGDHDYDNNGGPSDGDGCQ